METTRHFTATVYLVHDGATALHEHPRLDIRLPPGGHIDRDELPHEAALREAREETGLEPTLLTDHAEVASETSRAIPRPRHLMLADVNRYGDQVGHQHIDHVFFATVDSRALTPDDDEEPASAWDWYTTRELRAADVDNDVRELGAEAVAAAAEYSG
ncbi:NUDIX hydrolase [Salinigranum rubrum]|uniref:NUDIX hydrolase n=1 Tax=Salinigranum rubrum TaxID=755307 RepID=A0A2I8VHG7_9EURY|nr:NUDIX domain-containing protein [Salinigranum rubrum]AUV81383.1 NUDIX hydrolase [Salinigranum rubrum]